PAGALHLRAELLHERSERRPLRGHVRVVALDHDQLGHRLAGHQLALSRPPVAHLAERLRGLVRRVVLEWGRDHVTADAQVLLGQLREALRDAGERLPVRLVLPRRRHRLVERVHERMEIGRGEVVLLVQVAAGSTTSEKRALLVIRKSIVVSRSSFPSAASSRQTTSRGRSSGGVSSARTALSVVPSMCFRKYSAPLPDEPSRFARQTVITFGWLSGAPGSSHAKRSRPERSSSTTCSAGSAPARSASSTRSSVLRSKLGNDGSHPSRAPSAFTSRMCLPSNSPRPSGEARSDGRWRS